MGDTNAQVEDYFSKFDNEEENLVNFSDSLPETKETDTKETKEVIDPKGTEEEVSKEAEPEIPEDTPFHKHPRWQEKLSENKKLKEQQSEWKKEREELQARLEALESVPKTDEELEWMTPAEIQAYTREQLEKENAKKAELSKREEEEADRYIDESLEAIKDTGFNLTKSVENEILKYSNDYTEGDIAKAFELYQKIHQTKESWKEEAAKEAAKKKAAQTNRSNKGSTSNTWWFVRWTSWDSLNLK